MSVSSRWRQVGAQPEPILVDMNKTALIVVDMQNDFGTEGGMFHRAGIDISMIQAAIGPTARAVDAARMAEIPIIYLKMAFKEDLSDVGVASSPNCQRHMQLGVGTKIRAPNGMESRLLIRDTWNTDIVRELTPLDGDTVMYKHRFSGFFGTQLEQVLARTDIRYLVITGCTTSICVESTIRDAAFRDYSCVLLQDCTGEPIGYGLPRSNHDASLLSIQALFGWVSTCGDFIAATHDSDQIDPLSQGR